MKRSTSNEPLPELVDSLGPAKPKAGGYRDRNGVFWLDTGHGFEIGWSDGRKRTARNLPREAVELFGSLDDPDSLPRWLFYHELGSSFDRKTGERIAPQDRPVPVWHFGEDWRTQIGLPANWHEANELIDGVICCFRCGRSLYWADIDGREFCIVCKPPRFKDERSPLRGWRKLPGHVWGCDQW